MLDQADGAEKDYQPDSSAALPRPFFSLALTTVTNAKKAGKMSMAGELGIRFEYPKMTSARDFAATRR